jgi:hypothetical protein
MGYRSDEIVKLSEFYSLMNDVKSIDHIRKEWTTSRKSCDYWIRTTIQENVKNYDKALIIGAGGCRDFSLEKVVSLFNKTYIVDYDEASMVAAVKLLSEENKEKVEIITGDFTGIIENVFPKLQEKLKNEDLNALIKEVETFRDGVPKVFSNNLSLKLEKEFDFIFVDCITTQLFPPVFLHLFTGYEDMFVKNQSIINNLTISTNQRLLTALFKTLKKALVRNGVLAISSDTFEINSKNRAYLEKKHGDIISICNKALNDKELIKDLRDYTITGAINQVIEIIKNKVMLKQNNHLVVWPWFFSSEKSYLVYGTSFVKK